MVARLTPDQKVACSIHVRFIVFSHKNAPFLIHKTKTQRFTEPFCSHFHSTLNLRLHHLFFCKTLTLLSTFKIHQWRHVSATLSATTPPSSPQTPPHLSPQRKNPDPPSVSSNPKPIPKPSSPSAAPLPSPLTPTSTASLFPPPSPNSPPAKTSTLSVNSSTSFSNHVPIFKTKGLSLTLSFFTVKRI